MQCPGKPVHTVGIENVVFLHTTGSANKDEKLSYLFDDSDLDY